MNTLLEKMIRTKLIDVHKSHGIDYSDYSREWKEFVEKLAWNSVHGMATVRNITIDEAIDEIL